MKFLLHILTSEQFVPAIICNLLLIIHFRKLQKVEKYAMYILLYNLLMELTAGYMGFHQIYNQWFYNLALFPDLTLYTYLFYSILKNPKTKKTILIISLSLIFLHAMNLLFGQGLERYSSHTGLPVNIFTVVMCYLYMHQCVEDLDENPFRNFLFWFSMATLIDLAGTIPVMATLSWLAYTDIEVSDKLYIIITVLYILWFILISTGLIWTKRIMKSASLS